MNLKETDAFSITEDLNTMEVLNSLPPQPPTVNIRPGVYYWVVRNDRPEIGRVSGLDNGKFAVTFPGSSMRYMVGSAIPESAFLKEVPPLSP